jgi:hypothetical protein
VRASVSGNETEAYLEWNRLYGSFPVEEAQQGAVDDEQ